LGATKMSQFAVPAAMLAAFVVLLRLGLPRADGTTRAIARNEHITSAYAVALVALLQGSFALFFMLLM
jgi:hypothetical protein